MAEDNPGHPLLNQPLLMLKDAFNPHKEIPFKQRLTRPREPDPQLDSSISFYDQLTEEEKNHHYTTSASPDPGVPMTEEYRVVGLTWHTNGVLNSCTLDSFLSGFIRWVKMSEAGILKKMFYPDRVGKALFNIARRAIKKETPSIQNGSRISGWRPFYQMGTPNPLMPKDWRSMQSFST